MNNIDNMSDVSEDISYSIEVALAMSYEQSHRDKCARMIQPYMPEAGRLYLETLEKIPIELCVERSMGWEKMICIEKSNIKSIIDTLYPAGTGQWNWKEIVDKIEGQYVWIIGFGD